MHTFANILFSPLDDGENPAAVQRIAKLASSAGGTLTLFGAVAEPSRLQRAMHRSDYLDQVQEAERQAMVARLDRYRPETASGSVETKLADGNAAVTIINEVVDGGHDLVVVTAADDSEDHATVKRLLRQCPCPVWVLRPTQASTQRVLAAINPDPSELALNTTILEIAAAVVQLFGGELHLVHAWELYGEITMRSSAFMQTPAAEVDALLAEEEATHRAATEELLAAAGLADEPWRVHLEKGPAGVVIPEVAEEHKIDLLVMGTVARTGVGGMIIGNTAETVLDKVRCSVLATKPPGFTSSVERR